MRDRDHVDPSEPEVTLESATAEWMAKHPHFLRLPPGAVLMGPTGMIELDEVQDDGDEGDRG